MRPILSGNPPRATATTLLPSAEQAMEVQLVLGALVCVQVWETAELTAINSVPQAVITSKVPIETNDFIMA